MEMTSLHFGDYKQLLNKVYENNPCYRDSLSRTVKSILQSKLEICNSSWIQGVMIKEKGQIVAACLYCIVDRMEDTLQMAYFESLENKEEAVHLLIDYGRKIAQDHGIQKILIGLNLHVNYGLGFLASHFQTAQSLGSAYHPPYYVKYFAPLATETIDLISYQANMGFFDFKLNQRVKDRIRSKYQVRKANFKKLEQEAKHYTRINNQAFQTHRFYYQRRVEEDLELFKEYRLFLKEENLLFLQYEDEPVGFMLWYPDFNQLTKPGETLGVKALIKSRLFPTKINRFKLVELGVVPKHQKSGGVWLLFDQCYQIVKDRYEICESGWILDENKDSKAFGERWGDQIYKQYQVFMIQLG